MYRRGHKTTPPPPKPFVYEKGYVVPEIKDTSRPKHKVVDKVTQKNTIKTYKSSDGTFNQEKMYSAICEAHPELAQTKHFKTKLFMVRLQKPPMKEPFLVSSPHWVSAGHNQKWPWKGALQCRLHSNSDSKHVTGRSCHTRCWKNVLQKNV